MHVKENILYGRRRVINHLTNNHILHFDICISVFGLE